MQHQPVPPERVFVKRDSGELYIWRGKTITPATEQERAYIEAKHRKPAAEKVIAAFDHDGDGKPGGSKPAKKKPAAKGGAK